MGLRSGCDRVLREYISTGEFGSREGDGRRTNVSIVWVWLVWRAFGDIAIARLGQDGRGKPHALRMIDISTCGVGCNVDSSSLWRFDHDTDDEDLV